MPINLRALALETACPNCGSQIGPWDELTANPDWDYLDGPDPDGLGILECEACGLLWRRARPPTLHRRWRTARLLR